MHALDRKLLRDFKRLWVQGLAIALVLAAGIAVILMSVGMSRALDDTRAAYYDTNRFAHVFASARRAPLSILPDLRAIEGVAQIEAQVRAYAVLDIPGRAKPATGLLISRPEGEAVLNIPLLRSGHWPETNSEVVVNRPFFDANGFALGDELSVNLNGRKRSLTISGTALSPEFVYTIGPGALMPQNETFGILWLTAEVMDASYGMSGAFNTLGLALLPRTSVAPVKAQVKAVLDPYGATTPQDRSGQQSNAFLDAEITQLRVLAYVLPPVFLLITVFLVSMVMSRIVQLERSEIGLMKAIGYTNLEIALHYLMLAGLIAALGVGIGWLAGSWLALAMARLYAQYFDFPFLVFGVPLSVYAWSAGIGVATTSLGALRAAFAAARLAPAVAMAPPAPPRFQTNLGDRAMAALHLSQPSRMILRALLRWPLRAGMTLLGMALAVAVLVASNFFPDAMEEIIDSAFYQSNRQDMLLLFDPSAPVSAVEDVRRLPGVMQVEPQQYYSARLINGPYEKLVPISSVSASADLARVVDGTGQAIAPDPSGVLLSDRLASALHVTVGDSITVSFESGLRETHQVPVTGVVTQFFGLGAYMDETALNRMFRQSPRLTNVNLTLADPGAAEEFESQIKDFPRLVATINMTENRQSFLDTLSQNILVVTTIYGILGTIITVGVAYNATRVQLSERARELASLRILGFSKGEVAYILAGEVLLLALIAQPVGWALGAGVASLMTSGFSSDLYAIPLVLEPGTFARASLIVLGAATVSVALVARRLNNLDLIAVMKTRE
ncbi:FtsX-like permease family protein [Tropicibacter naphthalenivorans]|uniref:Lipoprotein releasing system, transmembrane protein, LolC/E family n=1 Tax=Tropicibacter naphthalenivorans TaxID=441103 RepID=A0A0P1G0W8_9RHOB|nr:FtsX-like permease family protein [Tropicibacter naphthalenivorans]CUH75303.1 lipoprotein releasing system, transmembrane protein, LolC/E family [Tropicibacter naphthalenivorans]SMC45161.1 putative ABC transport system permease protein [Tropicibacter naphthalenivorans]